jgi:hypothetical protein
MSLPLHLAKGHDNISCRCASRKWLLGVNLTEKPYSCISGPHGKGMVCGVSGQVPLPDAGLNPLLRTGARSDPRAELYAVAIFSGQSFETLEASMLRPSDFVSNLRF